MNILAIEKKRILKKKAIKQAQILMIKKELVPCKNK
jgi:hypothetical protein